MDAMQYLLNVKGKNFNCSAKDQEMSSSFTKLYGQKAVLKDVVTTRNANGSVN